MKPILNGAYICVKNMNRAIEFYENFLDKSVDIRDDLFSKFSLGKFKLYLFNPEKAGEKVSYGDNCLLSFQVDNIDDTKNKLVNLGVEIVYPKTKIGSNWVLEFKDPEGNDVEVWCPLNNS